MKEVTRIHIAKVVYDIEIDAKKSLDKYVSELEHYVNDHEIVDDVEVRITEILAERGVKSGGVVSLDDVNAIKDQLGEPKEFSDGDKEQKSDQNQSDNTSTHRLYRDQDGGIVGGVMSGIAKYFDINVLWPRLIFIVLLISSFGTMMLVYIILWIVVPPAKTAAEKLELEGRPVNLNSIKEIGQRTVDTLGSRQAVEITKNILLIITGIFFIGMAIVSLGLTILGGSSLYLNMLKYAQNPFNWLAISTLVTSGLMATIFFSLCVYLVSKRKTEGRIVMALKVVVAIGLLSFMIGVGSVIYGKDVRNRVNNENIKIVDKSAPEQMKSIKNLVIESNSNDSGVQVEYRTNNKNRIKISQALSNSIQTTVDGDTMTVKLQLTSDTIHQIYPDARKVYIDGPKLASLKLEKGVDLKYFGGIEDAIDLVNYGNISLYGDYKNVKVQTENGASTVLIDSKVANLDLKSKGGQIAVKNIDSLNWEQPENCSGDEYNPNTFEVFGKISSGQIIYNGVNQSSESFRSACGKFINHKEDKK